VVKNYEEMTPKTKKKLYFFPDPFGTSDKIIVFKNEFYLSGCNYSMRFSNPWLGERVPNPEMRNRTLFKEFQKII